MTNLDIEAVQAFVLVADFSSFTRAGEAMDSSQSAVSLKIKRLEEKLGRRLLERTPRQVSLTLAGNAFLESARALVAAHQAALSAFDEQKQRKLAIGASPHIIGTELPVLLERMHRGNPSVTLELHIGASGDMFTAYEQGKVDAAFVLKHDNRRQSGKFLFKEEFGWMAAPHFEHVPGKPLRLATEAAPCGVRAMALSCLDKAGIAWVEVFVGGGIATIGAAVSAGFAMAALGKRVAPAGSVDMTQRLGLPALLPRDVLMYSNTSDKQAQAYLKSFAAAVRATTS